MQSKERDFKIGLKKEHETLYFPVQMGINFYIYFVQVNFMRKLQNKQYDNNNLIKINSHYKSPRYDTFLTNARKCLLYTVRE